MMKMTREEAINKVNFANEYFNHLRATGKTTEEIREANKELIYEVQKLEQEFGYIAFSGNNREFSITAENFNVSGIGEWR